MYRPFVPPYVLERVAASEHDWLRVAPDTAASTLRHDAMLRLEARGARGVAGTAPGTRPPNRTISDAHGTEQLPGTVARREGAPPTGDVAVDQAYDGFGATHALFADVYDWDSLDNAGAPLDGTVHYGRGYDNAFWDGTRMVFGDGDGEVFRGFTGSVTVIAHELTHGVTQHTANLAYQGQSGALNESISDVFGALVEQYQAGQTADAASWLIGAEVFTDAVHGVAMRSMLEPGTAYDDDVLGRDPQPAHMRDYVRTGADNGGVHVNSGIANRAFALAARRIGGYAWERAGRVWFDVLTGGELRSEAPFGEFARLTIAAAAGRYGAESDEVHAVYGGWADVGVLDTAA